MELTIQGRRVEAKEGESLLELARRLGYQIPTLCHHKALTPYGACRVCLVEVSKKGRQGGGEGEGKLVAACTHPVLPGLEVSLDTPRVTRARRIALELLVAHAPEADEVLALARSYGVDETRFEPVMEPRDCVICGLCERVCREVVGVQAIGLAGRGGTKRLSAPFGDGSLCIGCGACEALCPTGVLHEMREEVLQRLRRLPGERRPCRYSLMGILPGALCANDYRCEQCETEQAMVDRNEDHPLFWAQRQAADGAQR